MSPSFSFQKQINNNAILPLRRGKERDETWMATPSFTKIKNKKFWLSWHEWKIPMALKSKYLPLSCPSWAHVRYPPTTWRRCWHLVMQTARELKWGHWQCHLAGNRGHTWDIRPIALAKCEGLDLLFRAILSIKHTYLQTSLSAFSFFQENIGNCITLPISIVHLCLFLYSLCTGNVFWLRFKSISVPPKRSSLL